MNARVPREHGVFERWWGLAVGVGTTLAALVLPVRVVFGAPTSGVLVSLDWATTALLALDVVHRIVLERRAARTAGNVAESGSRARGRVMLLVDILAAVPLHAVPIPPQFQLIRLVKLARVTEMLRHWRDRTMKHLGLLRLVVFFYWLSLSVHWIACGWLSLRGISQEYGGAVDYIRALYWTVTTIATVGYGDITPSNPKEMMFAVVVMIFGAGVYGYTIGTVAGILANMNPAEVHYRELVERLGAFMRYRKIPSDLQRRIRDYYAYLWDNRLGYDETTVLTGLPPNLKAEVALFLNRSIIERVPLFRGASEELIRAIVLELRPVIFTPGDTIMRAGEPGREMYFISRGSVEVGSADGTTVFATLTTGDFFGEMAIVLDQPRAASVRALEYCDLFLLEKDAFVRVMARFPEFAEHIKAMANERRTRTTEPGPGHAPWTQ